MIRSYSDHSANERTFLAWVRTGLSVIAFGVVVKKGSVLATVTAGASVALSTSVQDHLSNYGGPALMLTGLAAIAGAVARFVYTALRIDDQDVHSAGIVRLASPVLRRQREALVTVGRTSRNAGRPTRERSWLSRKVGLKLIGGTGVH
ncbi:YidH family protein [Bradyrhizobium sp. Pha-3]|uniref:YidH family protein n=1 Tax=Bradyrhizobium sp. Pha-3 TaxID=208375 RepID=UPI0035D47C78